MQVKGRPPTNSRGEAMIPVMLTAPELTLLVSLLEYQISEDKQRLRRHLIHKRSSLINKVINK